MNAQSQATSQVTSTKEIQNKARTLIFDTGHVVCSALNISSNLSITRNHTYLASLLPFANILELPQAQIQFQNAVVPLDFEGGQVDFVRLHCLLQKFNQLGQLDTFFWPTGAYVSGILRGRV